MVRAKTKADTTMETVYKLIEILDTITSIPDWNILTNKITNELAALNELVGNPKILDPVKKRFRDFGEQLENLQRAYNNQTKKDFANMFISLSEFNRGLLTRSESRDPQQMATFILKRFPRLLALVNHLPMDGSHYLALRSMFTLDAAQTNKSLYDTWSAISTNIETSVYESIPPGQG